MHSPFQSILVQLIRFETKARMGMRSTPAPPFFIFQLKNILRSNLKFSPSYGRSTDFKSFFIFTYGGRTFAQRMQYLTRHRGS